MQNFNSRQNKILRKQSLSQIKLLIIAFIFIISIFSCNQKKTEKVCILAPEQIPEIRGLYLGMTQEQIEQKYPNLFTHTSSLLDSQLEEFNLTDYQDKKNIKILYVSSTISEPLSNKVAELKDISAIVLVLAEERLSALSIKYISSTDTNFPSVFKDKILNHLHLSSFTNWEKSFSSANRLKSYQNYLGSLEEDKLLCNQAEIIVRILTIISKTDKSPDTYHPILTIKMTNQIAMTESQEKQSKEYNEQQKRNTDEKRKEGEKGRTETFTP